MKIYIILSLLLFLTKADDLNIVNYMVYGNSIVQKGEVSNRSEELKLNSQIVYKIDNVTFHSEFIIIKPYDEKPKYGDSADPKIYNRAFNVEYKMDDLSVTAGTLSFVDDCYMDTQTIRDNTRNNGISTLVQTTYDALFVSKRFNNKDLIKVGYGAYNKIDAFNKENFMIKENDGSEGLFLLGEHYEPNNRRVEANIYDINMKYLGDGIGKLYLGGMSWLEIYPDSGIELYSSAGVSYLDKHISTETVNKILTSKGIPLYIPNYMPDLFRFDDEKGYGYNVMIGASKELDVLKSVKVGAELYYASKNFTNLVSPASGKPYDYDNRGKMLRLFSTIDINKDLSILTCGYWFKRDYSTKIGGLLGEVATGTTGTGSNYENESLFSTTIRWRF